MIELDELLTRLTHNHWRTLADKKISQPENEDVCTLLDIYTKFFNNIMDIEDEFLKRPDFVTRCEKDEKNPLCTQSQDLRTYNLFKKTHAIFELSVNQYLQQLEKSLPGVTCTDLTSENTLMELKALVHNTAEPLLTRFHQIATKFSSVVAHSPRNDDSKTFVDWAEEQHRQLSNLCCTPQIQVRTYTL